MANEIARADAAINDAVSDFVKGMMNDTSSDLYQFILSMMVGFAFIGIAWHVIQWAIQSIDLSDLVIYILSCFLVFAFYANYDESMSEFWSWSDGISIGIQERAVGNTDPTYIGSKLVETIRLFFVKDVSILDGFRAGLSIIVFYFIVEILEFVIVFISIWSVWGYSFAKIMGLFFLPLLFLPITRSFFEKWFQIFIGFWFFNLFSKVILAIYYLYFFAIFGVVDGPIEYDPKSDSIALGKINLHFAIGIFFLLSSAGLSAMMASGFHGVASGAIKSASAAAKFIAKLFIK